MLADATQSDVPEGAPDRADDVTTVRFTIC
jgi:hypothetical protein